MKKYIICFLILFLFGCSITSKPDKRDIENRLTYFKDSYGMCYAAIQSQTYVGLNIISITAIPCEKININNMETK